MADMQKCNKENSLEATSVVATSLGFSFPGIHYSAEQMAALSLELKKRADATWCELPFCQTVEAECLGAEINMGDGYIGPRAGKPVLAGLQDILDLSPARFDQGRAAVTLEACSIVREAGERAAITVSGPLSVANALIDVSLLLKAFRKNPELAFEVMDRLGSESLEYVRKARDCGVGAIRYADPLAAVDIVGPKVAQRIADEFTLPYLKRVREVVGADIEILVCPKTAACLPENAAWKVACRWQG